ncbi:hypothetical protein [Amycolatopsis palatopharyngis]|uniref:hypothetical protein n=1 Tax=Amycolatopsis palatopharyngis TaxID=187982 RepID=UPI000E2641A4|nr:hypothetical protein [Amycolatopsis palatopharyngis]
MTGESLVGEFKLQRQKNGIGYFGAVKVEVSRAASEEDVVVWSVPNDDRTSIQPTMDSEFVDAAVAGVKQGRDIVRNLGVDVSDYRIAIVHSQLNLTDIEETAVRAAGALAVATAFGVEDRVELRFDAGWHVAPVTSGA